MRPAPDHASPLISCKPGPGSFIPPEGRVITDFGPISMLNQRALPSPRRLALVPASIGVMNGLSESCRRRSHFTLHPKQRHRKCRRRVARILESLRGRARDQADWLKDAKLMVDAGNAAYKAAQAKDAAALAAVGNALDASCTTCHKQYRPNVFPREGGMK